MLEQIEEVDYVAGTKGTTGWVFWKGPTTFRPYSVRVTTTWQLAFGTPEKSTLETLLEGYVGEMWRHKFQILRRCTTIKLMDVTNERAPE